MNIFKRVGCSVLALLLILSMVGSMFPKQAYAATTPTLSVENKSVKAGEQFTVAVSLTNATSVYGGNFTLQYNNNLLDVDSYTFGSIVSGHTKNCNLNYQSAGNLIRFTFSGASALSSSGTLVTLSFTAKESVSGSATLQFNAYKMYDENGSSMTSTASGSTIAITYEPIASPVISIDDKKVTVGETFSVPVVINDSENIYGGNFTLQYDSNLLEVNSYSFGSIVSGHTKNCNLDYQSTGNQIRFTFSGASALGTGGTLITFEFTAKAEGTAKLKFNAYKMYDENGGAITTTITNGEVTIADALPTSISILSKPSKTSYYIGDDISILDMFQFSLKVYYSDGSNEIIHDGFGVSYNFTSAGVKTVTVSYKGCRDTYTVNVQKPSITLSTDSVSIKIGDTSSVKATTDPGNRSVTWTSSNTSVATVSNGTITGKSVGTAKITAKIIYNDYTYTSECYVTVTSPQKTVTSISIYSLPSKTTYYIGDALDTTGLELMANYSDGSWEVISGGLATSGFDSTTEGVKKVKVTYDGLTVTFSVTVQTPSITLSSSSRTMEVGSTSAITATTNPNGQSVVWTSSNTSVAMVSNGTITAKSAGTATITAKIIYNGIEYVKRCSVTVWAQQEPEIVSIEIAQKPYKTEYYIGDSLNTSGLQVWKIYSDGSRELTSGGLITRGFNSTFAGVKELTVEYGGFTDTFTVTVKIPSIELSTYNLTLEVGETVSVEIATVPSGCGYTTTSLDTSIATVWYGLIEGRNVGRTVVVASFIYNGIQYEEACVVTVVEPVSKGYWCHDNTGWWYQNSDGTYPYSCWKQIDGEWYYFNASGYIVTGWRTIGGTWYYFDGSGAMVTGWQSIGGTWYYFNGSGAMVTGWQSIGGTWYYFNGSGAMVTGWKSIGGLWYYFNASGAMAINWHFIGGKWYHFNIGGIMVTGWQPIDGLWYYFHGSGAMAANQWIGNYYLQADGSMATNKWIGNYYVDANGVWVPGKTR